MIRDIVESTQVTNDELHYWRWSKYIC